MNAVSPQGSRECSVFVCLRGSLHVLQALSQRITQSWECALGKLALHWGINNRGTRLRRIVLREPFFISEGSGFNRSCFVVFISVFVIHTHIHLKTPLELLGRVYSQNGGIASIAVSSDEYNVSACFSVF